MPAPEREPEEKWEEMAGRERERERETRRGGGGGCANRREGWRLARRKAPPA